MKRFIDIRLNIGLILTIMGVLILFTGLISSPELKALHGVNIDLIWGIVTTIIGILFLLLYGKRNKA